MPSTPEEQTLSMIQNFPAKTGRSLEEWLAVVRLSGIEKHKEIIEFLQTSHGMTYGFANLVAHKLKEAAAGGPAEGSDLVEAMFAGEKAGLRPLYDQIIAEVQGFGDDVEISPKKAYVSLRRKKQFGILQPSTKTRLDLGLNLPGVAPQGRLEASGSFNSMVSHRVRLEHIEHVNDELLAWLRRAYEGA